MFKGCLLVMPLLILLQSLLYLWLSIWGLVLRECSQQITDIAKQPFQYIMDLIYFYDETCGQHSVLMSINGTETLLNFTTSSGQAENHTFIFLICYMIISSLWILTSLWTIFTSFCRADDNLRILSFGTWFTVVLAGSVLDAVATGYHIFNLVHTTSAKKTFDFLGIETSPILLKYMQTFDEYFLAPSVVMTCTSSRIVLIWLLNLSGSAYCLSLLLNNPKLPMTTTNGIAPVAQQLRNLRQDPNENFKT